MRYETIYSMSPIFMQNVYLSMYGARLYYERYFHLDRQFQEVLIKNESISKERIMADQALRLRNLINHAFGTTRYYQHLFNRLGMVPTDIQSIEDLKKVPLLKKELLRTGSSDIMSQAFKGKDIITLNTSGSTGKTLRVAIDLESRRKAYAFVTRSHRWAGLKNSRNNVTLAGRTIIPQGQKSKVFWRYNAAMSNYLFSTYHMSELNLPYYVEKIRNVAPTFIDAYPSAVYLLADFMSRHGITDVNPKAVLTSGETLFEHQRDLIEKVFQCPVFDQYGCTEQALFVSQCEKGCYHIHPEFGIVEILDEQDRPVKPGRIGRVVCTSFTNFAMPLIRYDLGDTAASGTVQCGCGRNFPILEKVCGRIDDYILTPDGNRVGRLDPAFKGLSSVKSAQIIQQEYGKVLVKIIPDGSFNNEDQMKLLSELRKRLGEKMEIEIRAVKEINLSPNGKFRAVINELTLKEQPPSTSGNF